MGRSVSFMDNTRIVLVACFLAGGITGCFAQEASRQPDFSVSTAADTIPVYIEGASNATTMSDLTKIIKNGVVCGIKPSMATGGTAAALRNPRMIWSINGLGRVSMSTISVVLHADGHRDDWKGARMSLQAEPRAAFIGAVCDLTAQSFAAVRAQAASADGAGSYATSGYRDAVFSKSTSVLTTPRD